MNSYGIKHGYPRLARFIGKLTAYIQLIRPFTLIAPLIAGLIGTITPVKNVGFEEVKIAIYAGVTLALLQASGQVVNQYADSELDKVCKPYRPIPRGDVGREEALGLGILLMWFGIMRGFWISLTFGTISMILAFMATYYSLTPFSPRRVNPFYNTAWLALSRGFIPVIAVWSIYGNITESIPYALIFMLWVLAFQPTKDIPDMEADRRFGVKTIPNTYGIKGYLIWATVASSIMVSVILAYGKLLMLVMVAVAVFNILTLRRSVEGVENTLAWAGYYLGLALAYVLMFIDYRGIVHV